MNPFRTLLRRSAVALVAAAAVVTVCYHLVDRPVAFFVRDHGINHSPVLRWLTETPMAFNALAPLVAVWAAVRRAFGPLTRPERVALAGAVSLMVGVMFEFYLKFLFGRYWPATWTHGNPSLLGTDSYGFHPFHFGGWYGSFPSGHTARAFAALTPVWVAYPRLRWVCAAVWVSVVVGLVGMDYHFVGDTVGGAVLGSLVGGYTAAFFGLSKGPVE